MHFMVLKFIGNETKKTTRAMFRFLLILFSALLFLTACEEEKALLETSGLTVEYLVNPMGIDATTPRLAWKVEGAYRGARQKSYQILVASSLEKLNMNQGDLWDTGKVESSESIQIPYAGQSLTSEQACFWKVRIWDASDVAGPWSETNHWQMGLLDKNDWVAGWIGYDAGLKDKRHPVKPWGNDFKRPDEYRPLPAPFMRYVFDLPKPVSQATLYATALGNYRFFLNNQRVGDDYFTPGWTNYNKRAYYRTYDVTALLQSGANVAGAILADGWYAGNVGNRGQKFYGDKPRLRGQLHVTYEDGTRDTIVTSSRWKAAHGPIREADMQGGESYDARMVRRGWEEPTFNDSIWHHVDTTSSVDIELQAYPAPPVRRQVEIPPQEISRIAPGFYLVDFGQNFAGWTRLQLRGTPGLKVEQRFAEMLNGDNTLYLYNLRSARATDTYICRDVSPVVWEPGFTYHGFRYVEISNYPGRLTKDKISGVVAFSDLDLTGNFHCSDTLINAYYQSALWSQRSNFFDIPTDCPQRDERAGWMGDIQVFAKAATYNMDVSAFFSKWLREVADSQYDNGRLPSMAPRIYSKTATGWGDAIIIVPWHLYQSYGDTRVLEEHYESMTAWMKYLEENSDAGICNVWSFGDWQHLEGEVIPTELFSTAYFGHSADLLSRIAAVLGKKQDAERYRHLFDTVRKAFRDKFILSSGLLSGNSQTAYVLALKFDLLDEEQRTQAIKNLVKRLKLQQNLISTGMHASARILPVLSESEHLDKAYDLLANKKYPSWGFQIAREATTPWERWDGYLGAGRFNDSPNNSLNHFAFGAYTEWFYSTIAGIQSLEPGYRKIRIAPRPGGKLTHATGEYESIRGKIVSKWEIANGRFQLSIEIPANTSARVVLPYGAPLEAVTENGNDIEDADGVMFVKAEENALHFDVLSGSYQFEVPIEK